MSETPKNQVLGTQKAAEPTPSEPAPSAPADYPKMLVHKSSQPGALITKQVDSAEEEKQAGEEWMTLDKLGIETAPAAPKPEE